MKRPKSVKGFKIPSWWDCQWRRMPCGKKSCRLCKRENELLQKHLAAGEDPNDMQVALQDVAEKLKEAAKMLKKSAKQFGVNLDELEKTEYEDGVEYAIPLEAIKRSPLQKQLKKWTEQVLRICQEAEETGEFWVATELAADLRWYCTTLTVKAFRQADNTKEIKANGDETAIIDHRYIAYVLKEILEILEKALRKLASMQSSQKGELSLALAQFLKLKPKILKL